eukprot:2736182-Rhodomonas_salina.2
MEVKLTGMCLCVDSCLAHYTMHRSTTPRPGSQSRSIQDLTLYDCTGLGPSWHHTLSPRLCAFHKAWSTDSDETLKVVVTQPAISPVSAITIKKLRNESMPQSNETCAETVLWNEFFANEWCFQRFDFGLRTCEHVVASSASLHIFSDQRHGQRMLQTTAVTSPLAE